MTTERQTRHWRLGKLTACGERATQANSLTDVSGFTHSWDLRCSKCRELAYAAIRGAEIRQREKAKAS